MCFLSGRSWPTADGIAGGGRYRSAGRQPVPSWLLPVTGRRNLQSERHRLRPTPQAGLRRVGGGVGRSEGTARPCRPACALADRAARPGLSDRPLTLPERAHHREPGQDRPEGTAGELPEVREPELLGDQGRSLPCFGLPVAAPTHASMIPAAPHPRTADGDEDGPAPTTVRQTPPGAASPCAAPGRSSARSCR